MTLPTPPKDRNAHLSAVLDSITEAAGEEGVPAVLVHLPRPTSGQALEELTQLREEAQQARRESYAKVLEQVCHRAIGELRS